MTQTHRQQDLAPFRLRGELDMACAREYRVQLWAYAAASEGPVVCDCADLEFLDSSGIAMLVDVQHELMMVGRELRLINLIGIPRVALEACGLIDYFGITEEAPAVLTPPAIMMLRHLTRATVVNDGGKRCGLSGPVAEDALSELVAAGYAKQVIPNGRLRMFVITAAGRRKATRLEPGGAR